MGVRGVFPFLMVMVTSVGVALSVMQYTKPPSPRDIEFCTDTDSRLIGPSGFLM